MLIELGVLILESDEELRNLDGMLRAIEDAPAYGQNRPVVGERPFIFNRFEGERLLRNGDSQGPVKRRKARNRIGDDVPEYDETGDKTARDTEKESRGRRERQSPTASRTQGVARLFLRFLDFPKEALIENGVIVLAVQRILD